MGVMLSGAGEGGEIAICFLLQALESQDARF